MTPKQITIIGLGGVGGYFGYKIAAYSKDNPAYQITFVARSETFKVVKQQGLRLISPEHPALEVKPDHIFESAEEIPQSDLILICVKEYDLEKVCQAIKSKVTAETIIIALMNGADIYDRVRKIIRVATLLPSCVYVASHIKEKGIVEHKGNTGKIIAGKDPENTDSDVNWAIDLLKNSGADITFKEDCFADIWTKFTFISSFGLVTARYNQSIGEVREAPMLKERAAAIMEEIKLIASKKHIKLPEDIIARTFDKAETFPYTTPTSLQLDINADKKENELELFAGAVINYGKVLGIKTDQTLKIYDEIKELLKQQV